MASIQDELNLPATQMTRTVKIASNTMWSTNCWA